MTLARLRWLSLGALGLLAACGSSNPTPARVASIQVGDQLASEQVLRRALDDTPSTIDPSLGTDVPSQRVFDDLFEGLTRIAVDGRASPGVASSWETSADGKVWTFHLRPGVRWSNGVPMSAEDFIYSWRREVDPKTGSQYAQGLAPILNALDIASGKMPTTALGAEAIDKQTIKITLNAPTPYLLDLLAQQYLYPVYGPVVKQYGDDWTRPEHIVSNGAFILREYIIGNRVTLEKNVNYWDASHVHLTKVVYYALTDQTVQANRFIAGDVDWTDSFTAAQRGWLKANLGDQVVNSPYYGAFCLGFNFKLPPFANNWPLRQALVLALDREPLVSAMREGMYQAAYNFVPPLPGYEQHPPDWKQLSDEARHALARKLYQQAGYSRAHPLRVSLDVPITSSEDRHFFEAVTATWHSLLGAEIQVREREFKVLLQERTLQKLPLYFDAWIGDYPDPYTFMQIRYTDDGNNNAAYSNPRYDQLVDQANQQTDNAKRYQLFEQAERVLMDDAAFLPLYFYSTRHLVKPYLRGWQSNIMDRNLSQYMYLMQHQEQ